MPVNFEQTIAVHCKKARCVKNNNFFYKNYCFFLQNILEYQSLTLSADATVAQLVEQLIRNEQVVGSSPTSSSKPQTFVYQGLAAFSMYDLRQ